MTYLLNSAQTKVAEYRYDPYGNTISSSGTLAAANVYRFSSKETHVNNGMYYYGYRFYDPNLQRWLNRDPIQERGGFNLYTYTANNPVTRIDPKGLQMDGPIAWPWLPSDISWHDISQFFQALTPPMRVHESRDDLAGGKFRGRSRA